VLLIGTISLALWRLHPPAVTIGIDAQRVAERVNALAVEPRPAGSEANARIRRDLGDDLRRLGYDVTIQRGRLPHWRTREIVPVFNIIARLDGTGGTGDAVLVASHFDSRGARSHGAGDAAVGVAAVMEVAHAFADDPPTNDVVVLLTDGEEDGLLGALLWAQEDGPAEMDVRVALNFEGRGVSGPSILFETGEDDAWLVDLYADAVPHPTASSLGPAVYELMSNATDFTIFLREGLPGLNFAFIGGDEHYHRAGDRIENLSPATMRHQAAQAVAVSRAVAEADLSDPPAGDAVFFDWLALIVIRYGHPTAIALAALTLLTVAGASYLNGAGWRRWLIGAGLTAGAIVAVTSGSQLLAWFLPHPDSGAWFGPIWIGLTGLGIATAWIFGWRHGRESAATVGIGAALTAVLTVIWLPGASYLPTLIALAAVALTAAPNRWVPLGTLTALTPPIASASWLAGQALTLQSAGVIGAMGVVLGALWLPLVTVKERSFESESPT
jgi:hypothetical protein